MATEIEAPMRAKGMVHKMIAIAAVGMAEEHYEQLASNNKFYAAFPTMDAYVKKNWIHYIHVARQIFTAMLGDPKRPEAEKEVIYEALMKDGAINPKKMARPEKPSFFLK